MVKVEIVIDFKDKNNQLQFNKLVREDASREEIELARLVEEANISIIRHVAKEAGVEIKENPIHSLLGNPTIPNRRSNE